MKSQFSQKQIEEILQNSLIIYHAPNQKVVGLKEYEEIFDYTPEAYQKKKITEQEALIKSYSVSSERELTAKPRIFYQKLKNEGFDILGQQVLYIDDIPKLNTVIQGLCNVYKTPLTLQEKIELKNFVLNVGENVSGQVRSLHEVDKAKVIENSNKKITNLKKLSNLEIDIMQIEDMKAHNFTQKEKIQICSPEIRDLNILTRALASLDIIETPAPNLNLPIPRKSIYISLVGDEVQNLKKHFPALEEMKNYHASDEKDLSELVKSFLNQSRTKK